MERSSKELKVMLSVGGPAGTGPFYSRRNPNGSDLNKGAPQEGGREESL